MIHFFHRLFNDAVSVSELNSVASQIICPEARTLHGHKDLSLRRIMTSTLYERCTVDGFHLNVDFLAGVCSYILMCHVLEMNKKMINLV
jgi:hypothetical protein